MIKEQTLLNAMRPFWQSLTDANDELNSFIAAGVPPTTGKRHKAFLRRWDDMKEKAAALCDAIEQLTELNPEPVEVKLPFDGQPFADAWNEWKDYLAEQHNKRMKSRMERAALAHLKELSGGNEETALQYLRFAMANGYPRFFKVTEKSSEQPAAAGGRSDGDF